MNNPFLLALKTNPAQFLEALSIEELNALAEGAVSRLAAHAEGGDRDAVVALNQLYRIIGEVEI